MIAEVLNLLNPQHFFVRFAVAWAEKPVVFPVIPKFCVFYTFIGSR